MTETQAKAPARTGQGSTVPTADDRALTPFWMLRNEVDDLFDDFFRTGWSGWPMQRRRAHGVTPRGPAVAPSLAVPSLDVIDKENEVKLIADLPGLSENDIDVQVNDSTLTISGEKKEEVEEGDEEGERYVSERRFGSFTRRISLPEGIDQDKIDATFRNGVLTVRLPKTPEAQNPARKIEVKAAT